MRRIVAGLAVLVAGAGTFGRAQDAKTPAHVVLTPADVKWGEPPPALPKGAMFMVVSGDPGKPGPFALRLKLPAGYKIQPHWHPTDEHVTVLSGTFALGMGEKFDPKALKDLPAGGYGLMPAQMRHFAMARPPRRSRSTASGPSR